MHNLQQPWNIVFLVGFAVYTAIRHVFARRTKGERRVVNRFDTLEGALLGVVAVGSLLLPALYLVTSWLDFADYRLPAAAPWLGSAIMVGALWLFWRSHADLGRNWSVTLTVRQGHEVVEHGVYRRIRHPMYASIWLWSIAQALLLSNWLAGWSALVSFAPLYFLRAPREEQMMCEFFGQQYRDYMGRTGRLVPRIRSPRNSRC